MCSPLNFARSTKPKPVTSFPATRTAPEVGVSRQPIKFRSVVLPLPEGPIKLVKDARGICSDMFFRASIPISPTRYVLPTPCVCTIYSILFIPPLASHNRYSCLALASCLLSPLTQACLIRLPCYFLICSSEHRLCPGFCSRHRHF